MPRLCWLLLALLICLANSGCAAIGTAAGLYALSQSEFKDDVLGID
jgi:hypothetical protein